MIVHPMKVGVMKKTKIIHINRIGENTDGNKYKCTKNVIIGDSLVDYCTYQEKCIPVCNTGKKSYGTTYDDSD